VVLGVAEDKCVVTDLAFELVNTWNSPMLMMH
jgi:hypothetical protein